MALPNVKFGASSRIQHAGIICRATVAFFTWQGLRAVRRHSRAGTLMPANAASVLTQSAAHILRFGVLLPASSLTGRGFKAQSNITGLGASTKLVRLSHSLESWQQLSASTVARPHLNLSRRVFPGRANGQKPNCKFNVDANTGHGFAIFMASVGALRPSGSGAS
ncbi:hypothetical protein WIT60_16760 [Aquabacterium sp. G14]|jgi:hypothetical protein|uniref:hypothetical protein n=1 Tax=Aquabacterium sp. G14 TaxID=3130164 RepID=UPI00309CBAF5